MKDHHRVRAWDGVRYWTINNQGIFISEVGSNTMHSIISHGMELELCTGLRDKNGTLIYEGDKVTIFADGQLIESPVFMNSGAFWVKYGPYHSILNHCRGPEIIGNIHQGQQC